MDMVPHNFSNWHIFYQCTVTSNPAIVSSQVMNKYLKTLVDLIVIAGLIIGILQ